MSDINELLELTKNIKEEDYKTKVTEKLKQLQVENKKLITEGKIKINQLTTLSEFFPDSEILKEELENIKELEDLNQAPLTTIKKEISSINIALDKQLDFAIEHTAKIINDAYQNLEQVQKLTTKPLIKKVKTLIKTPSDEKRKV